MSKIYTHIHTFLTVFFIGFLCMPVATVQAFLGFFESDNKKAPDMRHIPVVSIFVEDDLLDDGALRTRINRYSQTVQDTIGGRVVQVPLPRETNPRDIFEANASLYYSGLKNHPGTHLVGTILIGDVPLPLVDKNGAFWPSIFPYTDIEKPSYEWNADAQRFVFSGEGDGEPDIWHGVIRAGAGKSVAQKKEDLLQYFDQNTAVHSGDISFGKRFLAVDVPRQKRGLDPLFRSYYDRYIEYLEDVVYLRYTKHWAQELQKNSPLHDAVPWDLLPEDMQPDTIPDPGSETPQMPDVQSKVLIDTLLKNYATAWGAHLERITHPIVDAQRWTPSDIETTISLVTQKDMLAARFLKNSTDTLEKTLLDAVKSHNVSATIGVPVLTNSESTPGQPPGQPLYWNGVARDILDSEDCSLLRGTLADEDHPWAQMVEANRSYNPKTGDECQGYGGCCWEETDVDEDTYHMTNDACVLTSTWTNGGHKGATNPVFDNTGTQAVDTGAIGAFGCAPLFDRRQQNPSFVHRFDSLMVHDEPRPETIQAQIEHQQAFDIPVDDPRGFSFFDHQGQFHRENFINLFDYRALYPDLSENLRRERLAEKIREDLHAQIQALNVRIQKANTVSLQTLQSEQSLEWPDAQCQPSGVWGCFDAAGVPLGLSNCREYTRQVTHPDPFTTRVDWHETCTWNAVSGGTQTEERTITRLYERADLLDESLLIDTLESLDIERIVESILWIDRDIADKNEQVLSAAFQDISETQAFFFDPSFEGFEGVHLVSQSVDSRSHRPAAVELGFEVGETESGDFDTLDDFSLEMQTEPLSFVGTSVDKIFSDEQYKADDPIILYKNPETGKDELILPSEKNDIWDQATTISVTPESLNLSAGDIDPLSVQVTLKNKAGQRVKTDFDTPIRVRFLDSDGRRFFQVSPSTERTVKSGQTTFHFLPQDGKAGGQFQCVFETDTLTSDPFDITIRPQTLEVFPRTRSVRVGDQEGVRIEGDIVDTSGDILTHLFTTLHADSEWGDFENDGLVDVRNGEFKTTFFPGTVAGDAVLNFSIPNLDIYAQETVHLQPEAPDHLVYEGDAIALMNREYSGQVQWADRFGNLRDDPRPAVEWTLDGCRDIQTISESFRCIPDAQTFTIDVWTEGNDVRESLQKTVPVISDATTFVQTSQTSFGVGDTERIRVSVRVQRPDGSIVPIDAQGDIILSDPTRGYTEKTVDIQKGRGLFYFFPGTKTGRIDIGVSVPHIPFQKQTIFLRHGPPKTLVLGTEEQTLDFDTQRSTTLIAEVRDAYGNRADSYSGSGTLAWNEPDRVTEEDVQTLIARGAIPQRGAFVDYLRQQSLDPDTLSVPNDPDLIHKEGGRGVDFDTGIARFSVSSDEHQGAAHITLKAPALTPAKQKISVTDTLTTEDIDSWTGRALLWMLSGFQGSFDPVRSSIGESLLVTGQHQAVLTNIVEPDAQKQWGILSADLELSGDMTPVFLFDDAYAVSLRVEGQEMATLRYRFDAPVSLSTRDGSDSDIVLSLQDGIRLHKETLLSSQGRPLLEILPAGGLQPLVSNLSFEPVDGALDRWSLYFDEERVGDISFQFSGQDFFIDQKNNPKKEAFILTTNQSLVQVQKGYAGRSTTDDLGYVFSARQETESTERRLGRSEFSIEDAHTQRMVGWGGNFKPFTLLAGGNTIGQATKWGASDALIVLGDPTLRISDSNTKTDSGVSLDSGRQLWKSSFGSIDQIFVLDVNGDSAKDIGVRVGNLFFVLYRDRLASRSYRFVGPVLAFSDGVQSLSAVDMDQDSFWDLIQVNAEGRPIVHKNTNGTFERTDWEHLLVHNDSVETVPLSLLRDLPKKDGVPDVVTVDEQNCIAMRPGTPDGFDDPISCECLAPNFEPFTETFDGADHQNPDDQYFDPYDFALLSDVWISYDGLKDSSVDGQFLSAAKTPQTFFTRCTDNPLINAEITIGPANKTETQLQKGALVNASLTLSSGASVSNLQVIFPQVQSLDFVPDSVVCDGCQIKPRSPRGAAWVSGLSLSPGQKTTLSWQLKVQDIPGIDLQVQFDGNHSYVRVPRKENGQNVFRTYRLRNGVCQKNVEVLETPEPVTEDSVLGDKTPEEVEEFLLGPLKKDSDGDGYPDMYDGPEIDAPHDLQSEDVTETLQKAVEDFQAQKTPPECPENQSGGLPEIPKVFLAPGHGTSYVPPMGIPSGFSTGTPVAWVPPPPASPTHQTSGFRFYVMPTTTGKVGLSGCAGSYISNIISPLWTPKCFLTVPSGLEPMCMGHEQTQKEKADSAAHAATDASKKQSSFSPKSDPSFP